MITTSTLRRSFGVSITLFAILLIGVLTGGPFTRLDGVIARRLNVYSIGHDGFVDVAETVTFFGSTAFLVALVACTFVALVVTGHRRPGVRLVAAAIVGSALNSLTKIVVGRHRPHFENAVAIASGKSFPSGHAMNSTVIYSALLVVAWPLLRTTMSRTLASAATIVLVALVACSRVALGVHYLSDVVGGILLGGAVTVLAVLAARCAIDASTVDPSTNGPSTSDGRAIEGSASGA